MAEEIKAVATKDLTPDTVPADLASLPNPHIDYTAVLHNELQNRRHSFASGLQALNAAKEGAEIAHNTAMAEMNEKHIKSMADYDRRISDMQRALDAVDKGLGHISATGPQQELEPPPEAE